MLSLCTNNFVGALPSIELGDLHELGICDNMLTGTLPGAWAETLPQLHVMRLDDNYIQGSIPGEWMNSTLFQTLHVMDVCHNSLEGPLPPGLTELNALSVLSLCNNYFNETLPPEWSNFTGLRSLDVCRNDLTGSVPLSYSQLYIAGLESLSACANSLSGDVSDVLMGSVNGPQVNLTVRSFCMVYLHVTNCHMCLLLCPIIVYPSSWEFSDLVELWDRWAGWAQTICCDMCIAICQEINRI